MQRSQGGLRGWLLFFTGILMGFAAFAQGSKADYERALSLAGRTEDRVFRQRIHPEWLPGATSFWYRVNTGPGAREWIQVNAITGLRQPLFDHVRLAAGLSRALGHKIKCCI